MFTQHLKTDVVFELALIKQHIGKIYLCDILAVLWTKYTFVPVLCARLRTQFRDALPTYMSDKGDGELTPLVDNSTWRKQMAARSSLGFVETLCDEVKQLPSSTCETVNETTTNNPNGKRRIYEPLLASTYGGDEQTQHDNRSMSLFVGECYKSNTSDTLHRRSGVGGTTQQ
jgi:hypothetical protein